MWYLWLWLALLSYPIFAEHSASVHGQDDARAASTPFLIPPWRLVEIQQEFGKIDAAGKDYLAMSIVMFVERTQGRSALNELPSKLSDSAFDRAVLRALKYRTKGEGKLSTGYAKLFKREKRTDELLSLACTTGFFSRGFGPGIFRDSVNAFSELQTMYSPQKAWDRAVALLSRETQDESTRREALCWMNLVSSAKPIVFKAGKGAIDSLVDVGIDTTDTFRLKIPESTSEIDILLTHLPSEMLRGLELQDKSEFEDSLPPTGDVRLAARYSRTFGVFSGSKGKLEFTSELNAELVEPIIESLSEWFVDFADYLTLDILQLKDAILRDDKTQIDRAVTSLSAKIIEGILDPRTEQGVAASLVAEKLPIELKEQVSSIVAAAKSGSSQAVETQLEKFEEWLIARSLALSPLIPKPKTMSQEQFDRRIVATVHRLKKDISQISQTLAKGNLTEAELQDLVDVVVPLISDIRQEGGRMLRSPKMDESTKDLLNAVTRQLLRSSVLAQSIRSIEKGVSIIADAASTPKEKLAAAIQAQKDKEAKLSEVVANQQFP